ESLAHHAIYPAANSHRARADDEKDRPDLSRLLPNRWRPRTSHGAHGRHISRCCAGQKTDLEPFRRARHHAIADVDKHQRPNKFAALERQKRARGAHPMNSTTIAAAKEPGEYLFEDGKLTAQQLEQARRRQQRLSIPQHRAIVDLNFASEEDTWRAVARTSELEFVDPTAMDLTRETLELV